MGIVNFIRQRQDFFALTKEKMVFFVAFMLFFPLPSYFVAGSGFLPTFYVSVIILAFIAPGISGTLFLAMVFYLSMLPLVSYVIVCFLFRKMKDRRWVWGMSVILTLAAVFFRIYSIVDVAGERHTYTAIQLYGEIF